MLARSSRRRCCLLRTARVPDQPIVMPVMTEAQEAGWHALMDLYEVIPDGWALVGGQLVHLWCAERGRSMARPTDDADAVLDVREHPDIHLEVTAALQQMGFTPKTTATVFSTDGPKQRPSSTCLSHATSASTRRKSPVQASAGQSQRQAPRRC